MLNAGDLKNKYIIPEADDVFIPCVEWFEWPVWKLAPCSKLTAAQAILSLFPPDCWDGYLSQIQQKEENERRTMENEVTDPGERDGSIGECYGSYRESS